MNFEIIGEILDVEVIASGKSVRDRARLNRIYGFARWRKLKGVARVHLQGGRWQNCTGTKPMVLVSKDVKRKRYLD